MTAFRISAAGLLFSLVTISSAAAVPAAPQALLTPPSDIVQVQSKVRVCKKVAVGPCGPGYARCETKRVCEFYRPAPKAPTKVRVF